MTAKLLKIVPTEPVKDYRSYLEGRGYKRITVERTDKLPGHLELVAGKVVKYG